MNKEDFEKVWKQLFTDFGTVWVHGNNFIIKSDGYEFKMKFTQVYLYWNKDLITILNLKDIEWLG